MKYEFNICSHMHERRQIESYGATVQEVRWCAHRALGKNLLCPHAEVGNILGLSTAFEDLKYRIKFNTIDNSLLVRLEMLSKFSYALDLLVRNSYVDLKWPTWLDELMKIDVPNWVQDYINKMVVILDSSVYSVSR